MSDWPLPPRPGLNLSVTGHRAQHASYPGDDGELKAALKSLFGVIKSCAEHASDRLSGQFRGMDADQECLPIRLHTLLADGVDQICAHEAKAHDWQLSIPLPFGEHLAMAINALPASKADVEAILQGREPTHKAVRDRLAPIAELMQSANRFELADQDEKVTELLLGTVSKPDNFGAAQDFALETGVRFALAARILVEQAHLLIAVWDGQSVSNVGGTGHTVTAALEAGVPVLWIDPAAPKQWKILHAPEALFGQERMASQAEHERSRRELQALIEATLLPDDRGIDGGHAASHGVGALSQDHWRAQSNWTSHAYRRVEASLGRPSGSGRWQSVRQTYETPDEIEQGSGKAMLDAIRALPGTSPALADRIGANILQRHAVADGISTRLSDSYRGGMTINFLLASFAIISGIAYLPLVDVGEKWIFALAEFVMLLSIIAITVSGQRRHLHERWFETRRVAEYLRHSPLLVALGVSRPAGNWPQGTDTSWPEWYARQSLRHVGLPHAQITRDTLRHGLLALRDVHLRPQKDYHRVKAERLSRVHERLEHISDRLFQFAIVIVGAYLIIAGLQVKGLFADQTFILFAKICTVLAVALPTLGGAIAGLRFFGDFERFASISEVTAEKLNALEERITLLLDHAQDRLDYRSASDLLHAADAVVFSEIENWQSVFSAKHISVPV